MTILTKKIRQLDQKKSKSSKLRKQTSQALKSAKLLRRKSTSGINSIQRKMDKIHSELDDTSTIIQQKLAQRDSIKRLKDSVEERLKQEKERKKQIEEEISSVTGEAKKQLEFTLNTITDQVSELRKELNSRNLTAKKISESIDYYSSQKSKLSNQIKKTLESKPTLMNLVKSSKNQVTILEKKLPSIINQDQKVKETLAKASTLLKELNLKRKVSRNKSSRKKATERKRKSLEENRILQMAKKLATKMLSVKRKASRKPKAKRKASRKPKAKRKASRKPKAKRKASRKRR